MPYSIELPIQSELTSKPWASPTYILLVCTTVVGVLFVATPTSTISVYYCSKCTVCGHSHVYY